MLQKKAKLTLGGPYFSSYSCLVCGGLGFQSDSPLKTGEEIEADIAAIQIAVASNL